MRARAKTDMTFPCVVTESALRYAHRAGLIDDSTIDAKDCRVVESVRRLLALGLSTKEIDDLDIREPMLQTVCEFARLDSSDTRSAERAADAVEATLKVISEQIRSIDLEMEMLNMRKRALVRRTRALEKLARSLSGENEDILSA